MVKLYLEVIITVLRLVDEIIEQLHTKYFESDALAFSIFDIAFVKLASNVKRVNSLNFINNT